MIDHKGHAHDGLGNLVMEHPFLATGIVIGIFVFLFLLSFLLPKDVGR